MNMSSKLSKDELIRAWSEEIQRAGTLTVLHTNAIAQRVGASATEFEAVDVISRNQPITAGQLATFCGLTTGAITGLVDRLVDAGYIKRANDPKDRRKVLLIPVESSRRNKKVRDLYGPISAGFSELAADYSKEQLEFLIEAQARMNDMAENVIFGLTAKK